MRWVPKLSATVSLYSRREPVGDGQVSSPPLAVGHRLEPEVGGQADAEVGEVHRDHRAVEGERARAVGDDGERLAGGAPGVERAGTVSHGGRRHPRPTTSGSVT